VTNQELEVYDMAILSRIDSDIEAAQEKVERLEAIREICSDPETRRLLIEYLSNPGDEVEEEEAPEEQEDPPPGTALGRLATWFSAHPGKLATVAEMVELSGISISGVRQLVYQLHADKFKKAGRRGRERLFKFIG
jgi:hypothetical protein